VSSSLLIGSSAIWNLGSIPMQYDFILI
jgi:hypothetical protein